MDRTAALALYDALLATVPGVERKGDTVPYTSLGGHMFSALHKDGTVALRLPEVAREAFLKKYRTKLASHYGVVQPEYVVVPDALLLKTRELKPYFVASHAYVATLKPKAGTKTSAAKKAKPKARR
ncbi:MAG TPA: hypothetical protein VFV19_06925 [Candidatus Polarisedimenticolaceae bacterium]|nr:hypothetical protein [Candidatus Polarisedimenticolaceae bacterium]